MPCCTNKFLGLASDAVSLLGFHLETATRDDVFFCKHGVFLFYGLPPVARRFVVEPVWQHVFKEYFFVIFLMPWRSVPHITCLLNSFYQEVGLEGRQIINNFRGQIVNSGGVVVEPFRADVLRFTCCRQKQGIAVFYTLSCIVVLPRHILYEEFSRSVFQPVGVVLEMPENFLQLPPVVTRYLQGLVKSLVT